ncbi:hypothetical protein F7725_015176 [Dissostichus mawsoni]|uniref:Carboxylesterase type B domain-containing protein n=1 Tax=Dissostichus mawsoni TaxID=36200 RepID=A0A7J5YIR7_DISMA|nr:hypothetical protein F7725_015176 [Dissostichus mawsoni]
MRYVDLWNNMKMKSVVAIAVFLETVSAISLGLVNTEGGLVRGENIPLASGRHMDVFKGIPFADILEYTQFSGQELADRGNVIVVSIGYRVGSLGFLSTGEPELAGLFKRAISQSGVAVSPWTINKDPRQYAVEVALKVNCSTDERMASCLKEIDPVVLTLAGSFNLEDVEKLLAAFIKDKGDAALQAALSLYNSTWEPTPSQENIKKTLVDIETDFLFLASTQAALKLHADNAKTGRTYSYLFSEPNQMAGIIRRYPSWMGADNTDDVPYPPDLSGYMIAYWTNFARTGTGQKFVELNSKMDESYVGENMRMRYVDLWNNVIPSLRTIIPE